MFPWTLGTIVEQEYRRAVADKVAVNFEIFYQPTETWFEVHAYPSDVGLGIYFQDIDERKRTELARIFAEREIDRFFDISIDLLGVVNLDGYFARINPACEQVLGFTSAEMMAQPFIDFLHPDDIAATMAVFDSLSAGNLLVNFENRYHCRDGSYRWILWSAILEPERNLIYSSGRDITKRKRDEELLRQNEELTRRILESNRDCIKVVDLAGRLIYMNDYGQSLMEIDDFSTVANSQWLEFWQDCDRESAQTAFSIALVGEVGRFDGYCATHKGTPKWWEVIVTPILAADGQVSQILSVSRDITVRKIAELNDGFLYELMQRLRQLTDPEAIQWEAVKSLGKYLDVDRATWFEVNLEKGLATIARDWDRNGVGSIIGEYSIDEFASPTLQAALLAGKPIAISDVIADPLTAAHSDNYRQVGIRAFASIPCLDEEGRWVMTLHLNTSQNARIWSDDEIKLMQTLVTQLWSFVAEARAVQALRAQEEQTRAAQAIVGQQLGEIESIYQMAPVGLCFVDTDFRYVRINEQLAQINGLSVAEHIGRTFWEVLPEVADAIEPLYRQVMESGEPVIDLEVNGTNISQFGVKRWWLASFYPQTDERGRVIGVNNVVKEITDRKRLEAARLSAEQERDRFFDRSLDLLAIGNFEGYFERINPAFERLLGFAETEFISRPFIDFVHPEDRASTLAAAHSLANGQSVVDFENRCQCQDGSIVWVSWNATPYQQSNCWYSVGRDITERKRTEAALQESERMRRFMFEQTFELIGRVDLNGVLLEANQASLDSISAQSSEIVGQKFWETPWWHTEQLQQQLIDAIDRAARGEVIRYEVQFPDGNGNAMTTDFSLKPMFDEDGRIVNLIAEGYDITERKQIQADLEERNRELDSFVYVVSHDLKAPLRAVANLSQWIEDDLDGQLTDDTQSQMNLLRSRVNRMAATIDGLLDYARVGRSEDTIEPVAVARLLADVIDSVVPPPTFTISLPPELPMLSTRRLPLFQVFANLIGNGIKHHDRVDGSIQISIEDRGDCYEFAVSDDGSGIAPEHQDRMFKIFQAVNPQNRISKGKATPTDSTGIGLAIVKKIVEAEGGTIWLESELGKGTTFYFTWLQRTVDS